MLGSMLATHAVQAHEQEPVSLRVVLSDYGVVSASGISTDIIDSQRLVIYRADSPTTSFLELCFPCKVIDSTCKAKYKAKTGILTVSAQPAATLHQPATSASCTDAISWTIGQHDVHSKSQHDQATPAACIERESAKPSGDSQAQADEGLDDATLLREFADEAYLVSLHLNVDDTLHARQPVNEEPGPALAAAVAPQPPESPQTAIPHAPAHGPSQANAKPSQVTAEECCPTQQQQGEVAGKQEPSSDATSKPTPADEARGSNNTSTSDATHKPNATHKTKSEPEPAMVQLAAGINCSSLAHVFGCSFGLGFGKPANAKKSKKAERREAAVTLQAVADSLHTQGWAVCDYDFATAPCLPPDDYIPHDVVAAVRIEIKQMESLYTPGEIWVGKEADAGAQVTVTDVRGDSVLWMDDQALSATAFVKDGKRKDCCFYTLQQVVKAVDQLVMHELPRYVPEVANLVAGGRSDTMLACYPGKGSRFAKHIDNSANDGRRLTCLCYLNNGWQEQMGGALRLSSPGRVTVDVLPLGGRVAFFWSKTVEHEVRPTQQPRHSFTHWYYDAIEKAEALASAKVSGQGSPAAQAQARALLRDILAQDVITPTDEGCSILARRIRAMTTNALQIVAGVVGASSVQDFVYAASNMTPDSLATLRDEIGRMGLQTHSPTV